MRVGIPAYRLPKNILDSEIQEIEKTGVLMKTGSHIESLDRLFKEGYHSILIAVGAHKSVKLSIEGEDLPGVIEAAAFLRNISLGKDINLGKRVAVIGGGNVAIDAARSALRLGAQKVVIIYRRSVEDMPASEEEIQDAIAEGVIIEPLISPNQIRKFNTALEIACTRMQPGEIDSTGRRRPEPIPHSEVLFAFNNIITAVGQTPEVPAQFSLTLNHAIIKVDPDTLAAGKPGVFACGDAVSGPASIIQAMASGRLAAVSIDRFLGGWGAIDETLTAAEGEQLELPEPVERGRPAMPVLPVEKRIGNFSQVELGYSPAMAVSEAERCLRCDLEKHEDEV